MGFDTDPYATEVADRFADARTDGSEHFPVELVNQEALPKNIAWYPFLRGTEFRSLLTVELIPVLPSPDECNPLADPRLLLECTRLNTMAQNALLEKLAPMYFAGMQRTAIQMSDGWSPGTRVYNAIYDSRSVPPRYMAVTIERFPKGQHAAEHLNDITRGIPDFDPNSVTEDEVVPGQKVKRVMSTQSPRAFWASQNLLVLIAFLTPSPFDRSLTGQWVMHHPSNANSDSL